MRIAIALLCAATLPAVAGASDEINEINEIRKLLTTDPGDWRSLGDSVACTPTRTVAGAPFDTAAGEAAGAAYIFDSDTGEQLFRLAPSDLEPEFRFGWSVAATEESVLVGALYGDDGVAISGAVYVFCQHTGEQRHKLTAKDAGVLDQFGRSVAASGTRAIIGAPGTDDDGENSGSVYIFDLQSGQEIRTITAGDAAPGDSFGTVVDTSATLIAVGAPYADAGGLLNSGAVYIFDGATGQQLQRITAPIPEESAWFGRAVAISGDLVVVGAPSADAVDADVGVVYIFDAVTGQLLHEISAPEETSYRSFGVSVAISGTNVVVGSRYQNGAGVDFSGAAFVYDAASGEGIYRLRASDAAGFDGFGGDVAVLGNRAFIGTPYDDEGGWGAGSVYIFDITPCFADVNGDNSVGLEDLNIILAGFGQTTTIGDTNFDGVVDLADLNRVLSEFGQDCP